jgi:hypothetical protein
MPDIRYDFAGSGGQPVINAVQGEMAGVAIRARSGRSGEDPARRAVPAAAKPPDAQGPLTDGDLWSQGLQLVIGLDGDLRAWVRVANALLDCIASGKIRVGSRVPPATSLGLEGAVPHYAAERAFSMLAGEGVLYWVPGPGYHVRTSITVAVSDRPRRDGRLTAILLPDGPRRQHTGRDVPPGSGTGER